MNTAYLAHRLVFAVFVLIGSVTLIFFAVRLAPGDPAALLMGPTVTLEQVEAARERMGLNEPLIVQYGRFLSQAAQLDFGDSFRYRIPALALVIERVPATARLAATAMAIVLVVSAGLGIAAGLRPRSKLDRAISTFSLVGQSLPNFWVGIMLILVFARWLRVLPSTGDDGWRHLILPAITLALPFMSILIRLIRSGLIEVMEEAYVATARAKGLTEQVVVSGHAIRNMLIPVVTIAGLQFGTLLGGAVIVETVFSWPGVGRLLVDAIQARDFAVVQASIAFIAGVFIILNLTVDLLYGVIDPRVRLGERA